MITPNTAFTVQWVMYMISLEIRYYYKQSLKCNHKGIPTHLMRGSILIIREYFATAETTCVTRENSYMDTETSVIKMSTFTLSIVRAHTALTL